MHRLRFNIKSVPLALLLSCFAAYGALIPQLGFYWDDWPMMWFAHIAGPAGFPAVFSGDRPFLSLIYILTTSLLDTVPWQWQVLGILSRWSVALAFWWMLRQLWPDRTEPTLWMALLLAVYPGFKQMPISVVYGNGLLLVAPYFLSYGLMLAAIRRPERCGRYTVLGVIAYAFCVFSTEYYVGLDLIRGLFIWLAISGTPASFRRRALQVVKHWLPYLVVLGIFLIWRVLIFQFPTYKPELISEVNTTPLSTLLALGNRIFQDLFTAGWRVWVEPFAFPNLAEINSSSAAVAWLMVVAVTCLTWFYLSRLSVADGVSTASGAADAKWPAQAMLLGLAGLVLPGLPYWVTHLPLTLSFPYDRFHLAFMAGSCIFLVGLIHWLIRARFQKILLLSLVVGMAAGAHLTNANTYRREWLTMKDMFWQLSWRVPDLKPGTWVMTDFLPLKYYSDNSLTAPLNWLYGPRQDPARLDYYLGFASVRVGAGIPALEKGVEIRQNFRSVTFTGSTDNILTFYFSPPGCLRVIDPRRDADLPIFPEDFYASAEFSNPSQILTDPEMEKLPPEEIFGAPNQDSWCYYYQKADLARQRGDWPAVVRLADEAFPRFTAQEASELILFSEGYAHAGNWQRAVDLVYDAYFRSKILQNKLCKVMAGLDQELKPAGANRAPLDKAKYDLECPN